MTQLYKINGMHCSSCIDKVKKILEPLTTNIDVTLYPPRAKLTFKIPTSLEVLNDQLTTIGNYRLIPIEKIVWFRSYYPLILILLYVLSVSLLSDNKMNTFMAGFFLVFSGFKLLDLPGFARAYANYDILARHWYTYGFIYPFLECGFGFAYLLHWQPIPIYSMTILLMVFSSLGVIQALLNKQQIRCACLGSVLNLPMTAITLIEDCVMVIMGAIMLYFIL